MSTSLSYSLAAAAAASAAAGDCGDNPGYGNLYGGVYGDCPSDFEWLMISRLLMFTRQDVNLPLLTRLFSTRAEANIDLAAALSESFDIATADGDRLDILGTILQVSRLGLTDTQYRKRLQIQIDTLLTGGGTTGVVLSTIETWTGIDTDIYMEFYPASFTVSAQVLESEFDYLAEMIKLAKPGGVGASIIMAAAGEALICDSVSAAISGAGTMDSATTPIAGAELMGTVYSI